MKKFFKEMSALSWTIGGTGLVLITLSGQTRDLGIAISLISLFFHLAGALAPDTDFDKEE